MTEWSRNSLPYASRVQDLLVGGGLNGTTLLNASAFHSNGGNNTLTGGAGLDLFHGLLPADTATPDRTDWAPAQGEVFVDPSGVHVQVGIDARGLANPYVYLDNQWINTSSPLSLTLAPGTHTLSTAGGGSVTFQVGLSGVISYDPSLNSILSGRGTNQLLVKGAPVTVDPRALTNPFLEVDYYITEQKAAPFTLTLLPGSHLLSNAGGGSVAFTVNANDTVDYDPSLNSILSGRGTNQLLVKGAQVTVDARALSIASLAVDYYITEQTAAPFTVVLLPGVHLLPPNTPPVAPTSRRCW
jgi:hypothetical protein